ncbi:MAG: glycosyltransferase, partial [Promethearchaeota archaeon]
PWLIENNKSGLIFEPLKKKDLSNKIISLLSDKELIKKYGLSAHERFEEFPSNVEILNKTLKLYR